MSWRMGLSLIDQLIKNVMAHTAAAVMRRRTRQVERSVAAVSVVLQVKQVHQ